MFGPNSKPSRLSQWIGRRNTSGDETPWIQRVWRQPVLLRLGMVLVTAATVAWLVYTWGPAMAYRVGEVYPTDIRVRVDFEVVNHAQTNLQREEAVESLPANEGTDSTVREEEARRAVLPVVDKYPRGMPIVRRGEPIKERELMLLEEEHRAYIRSLTSGDHVRRAIALFAVISLLAAVVVLYGTQFQQSLAQSPSKIASICLLVVITLMIGFWLSRPPWQAVLIPLTITAMVLTIAYNPQFALLMSFSLTLVTTIALGTGLNHLLVMMGGMATAVMLLPDVRSRTRLVEVGFGAGISYLAMTVATGLLTGQTWRLMLYDGGRHLAWGVLAGYILSGSLPLVERSFGIVTDISLLKLADGSHPLLQELVRRAPGTYTHSMTVATLAESAAKAINANPVLARVGSYFHDIGKMLKPHYFVENQAGENRHDNLEPALSTLVIINHVKDGLELARQYNLPRPIVDFIQQHHGTTLVEYFYREQVKLQESNGLGDYDLESSFRYPGPKPQNRENGIVMLSDAVESSSRAMRDPAPSSLRKLVHDMLMKRLLDGQFEESGLTLTELHLIEESLCKSLIALYHSRIKYPEPEEKKSVA